MVANRLILLVEDDPESAFFVRYALKRQGPGFQLVHRTDAFSAMEYLQGGGGVRASLPKPLPDLILLDLKMPGMDGLELLEWLRAQPGLSQVPTCMLTGSDYPPYMSRARELGADAYLIKSADLADFIDALKSLLRRFCPPPNELAFPPERTLESRTASLAA